MQENLGTVQTQHVASAPHADKPRVLLVNLNTYEQPYPVYPLGLSYINGALRKAGYETELWDARTQRGTVAECAARFRPDFVGLSLRNIDNAQSHNPLSFVRDLADCCGVLRKVTSAPLIVGGSAFSLFPRELLELTGADYGIHGEGEFAMLELLRALREKRPVNDIASVAWHDTQSEQRVTHCNACPAKLTGFTAEPAHDMDVLKSYVSSGAIIGIQTQRGCPLKCCYCAYPVIEGRRSRLRTGPEVVDEMKRLNALGVRYTFFVDSVFNTRESHVAGICEALIDAKLDMEWECFLSPRGLTPQLLALMQRAGLRHIEFGSDSFCDSVLQSYGKSFTWDDIVHASEAARALDINYSHFLIFGGPGETEETIEETLRRTTQLQRAFYFATIGMRIYPGTGLWQKYGPPATGENQADYLVTPRFHIEKPLTVESLFKRLRAHRAKSPNWVVGDAPPSYVATMEKLRKRGIQGPLWEYMEVMTRYEVNG